MTTQEYEEITARKNKADSIVREENFLKTIVDDVKNRNKRLFTIWELEDYILTEETKDKIKQIIIKGINHRIKEHQNDFKEL